MKTEGKFSFLIRIEESDLFIICDRDIRNKAYEILGRIRQDLKKYILIDPRFKESMDPCPAGDDAPDIVKAMEKAADLYGVGPMAAVAGAVARFMGEELDSLCNYIAIENGGDIYLKSKDPISLAVWAGENSPFTGKMRFQVNPEGGSLGICTSSGMFGHSISFGKADAVVTISTDAALADAAATAIANRVQSTNDIEYLIEREKERGLLSGLIILKDDKAGIWGNLQLI